MCNTARARGACILCTLAVAGGLLRCYGLSSRSLWFDEAFTWQLVSFPFGEMLSRATADNSPPLYYVLLHLWSELFGHSAAAIRSLSVLCGAAVVLVAYGLARELNRLAQSRGVGHRSAHSNPFPIGEPERRVISPIVAGGLMAASPFQIVMSAEARPYALGVLLAALSTWAFIRVERGAGTWRTVLAYWLATALFVYTHHFAWFLIFAQVLFAVGDALSRVRWKLADIWRVPAARHVVIAIAAVILTYSFWLPTFVRQTQQVREAFWIPAPSLLEVSRLIYRMFVLPNPAVQVDPVDAFTAGILFLIAVGCLAWRVRVVDFVIVFLITTGLGLPLLFSSSVASIMNLRYLVFTHMSMLLGLAMLIERAPTVSTRCSVSLAAIGGSLFACTLYVREVDLTNPDDGFMAIARYLDEHRRPPDPVVVAIPYAYFPILAHMERKDNLKLYVKNSLLRMPRR